MGWIGVDLDGTLARQEPGQFPKIGEPIKPMMDRIRGWLDAGKEVRICTARAADSDKIPAVKEWLKKHGLEELQVTCSKDMEMEELWDDKAVQVRPNTGEPIVDARFQESLAREISPRSEPLSEGYPEWTDEITPSRPLGQSWSELEKDDEKT